MTAPAGWTLLLDTKAGAGTAKVFHSQVWYRVAGSSEPATYTWCHGPTGTSLLFAALAHAGVAEVEGWDVAGLRDRCLHSVLTSGVPHRLRPLDPGALPQRNWQQARAGDLVWARRYLLPWAWHRIRKHAAMDEPRAKRPTAAPPAPSAPVPGFVVDSLRQ